MKVLFNTISEHPEEQRIDLLIKLSKKYALKFPGDEVVTFVSSENENLKNDDINNFQFHSLKRSSLPGPLHLFTEKKIIAEIKKQHADSIVCLDTLPSQKINNQVFLAPPLPVSFFEDQKHIPKSLEKKFRKAIDNAAAVIVFSKLEKNILSKFYPGSSEKVHVMYLIPPSANHSLEYEEKQEIKEKIADGNEYFICSSPPDESQLTVMLKGFSGFKKWQKSGMKLVLTVADELAEAKVQNLLSAYRFKNEISIVKFTDPDYYKIIAGAYAALLPEKYTDDLQFLFDTVLAKVPLIIPAESIYSEITGDAAFQFKFQNKEDITRVLLESFREEQKRSGIIKASEHIIHAFTEEKFYTAFRNAMHSVSMADSTNQ